MPGVNTSPNVPGPATTPPSAQQQPLTSPTQAVLAQIRSALPSLRPSDAKVAAGRPRSTRRCASETITDVAAAAAVAEATVIHCAKELRFSGFQHLKFALAHDHVPAGNLLHEQQRLGTGSRSAEIIADVLRSTARALDDVPGTLDLNHFDAVVGCDRASRATSCVIGALPSLTIAEDAAYRLCTIGRPAAGAEHRHCPATRLHAAGTR